jgi:hypothetical protein
MVGAPPIHRPQSFLECWRRPQRRRWISSPFSTHRGRSLELRVAQNRCAGARTEMDEAAAVICLLRAGRARSARGLADAPVCALLQACQRACFWRVQVRRLGGTPGHSYGVA